MDFIHEIGWLLHRSELKSRLAASDHNPEDLFSLIRFKFLIEFSMDREWCCVMKKLLNILFEEGTVDPSPDAALSELCLLHRAVRKNSKPMVEMLLRFSPKKKNQTLAGLFRPDAAGPGGLTPLHIAAGKDGSEDVLDALTEDPGMVNLNLISLFDLYKLKICFCLIKNLLVWFRLVFKPGKIPGTIPDSHQKTMHVYEVTSRIFIWCNGNSVGNQSPKNTWWSTFLSLSTLSTNKKRGVQWILQAWR